MDYRAVLEEQIKILQKRQKEYIDDNSDDAVQKIIAIAQQIHYLVIEANRIV